MKLKKLFPALFCFVLCLVLAGCSPIDFFSAESRLKAPRLTGIYSEIQNALNKSIAQNSTLKYPAKGNYRSAITLVDVTGDKNNEAVAFCAATNGDVTSITPVYLENKNGVWKTSLAEEVYAGSVERLDFCDFNGDGQKEILVGYVTGASDKKLYIYTLKKGGLKAVLSVDYSAFTCCNLDASGNEELLVAALSTANSLSRANLYAFTGDEPGIVSSCLLDNNTQSHSDPVVTTLDDNRPAVYIDGKKSAGTITEILYLEDDALCNLSYNEETQSSDVTLRQTNYSSADIDSDASFEIPVALPLKSSKEKLSEDNYLTVWCKATQNGLVPKLAAYMNYTDGYYFKFKKEWEQTTCASYDSKAHLFTLCRWDAAANKPGEDIIKIAVVNAADWENSKYKAAGYTQISRSGDTLYVAFTGKDITAKNAKSRFKLILNGVTQ